MTNRHPTRCRMPTVCLECLGPWEVRSHVLVTRHGAKLFRSFTCRHCSTVHGIACALLKAFEE